VNVEAAYELVAELVAVPAPMSGQDDQLRQVDACLAGAAHDHDRALAATTRCWQRPASMAELALVHVEGKSAGFL
jgi:hypothetical protein